MAHYLVSGAAGFIGSRVIGMLLEDGHSVLGVDNLCDAYDVRMKEYRLKQLLSLPGFEFKRLDISNRTEVAALGDGKGIWDAVINLAARAGVRSSVVDPWVYVDANIYGTLNLLDLCRQREIPKFILASSSSLYGANNPMPYQEDANTDQPLQPYAASKKGAEVMCHAYHYLYGLDVTIFRYFTVYGPAGRPDMVMFRFAQWIAEGRTVRVNGDGEQSRGFTYLDDIARGTILGLKPLGFEIINLGGHEVISINRLITMLENRLGRKARVEYFPLHPADALANWANVEKARALLGWEPQVSLDEGVDRLTDWYLAERSWASQVETE
ncbi:MAG: NAD-dependent epimerase/dehydratase family protein [Chloroflexi bacterium]|nr:NAD-dependent epimerase/dehydratase family protein [Chloroflexota bacterium]